MSDHPTPADSGTLTFHLVGDAYDCGADLYGQVAFSPVQQAVQAIRAQAAAGQATQAHYELITGFAAGTFAQVVQEIGATRAAELFSKLAAMANQVAREMQPAAPGAH